MEFVVEFLLEIILEGVAAGATSRKVPMILRVLCAGIIILLFLAVIALILLVAFVAEEWAVKAIMILIAALFVCGAIYTVRKKVKAFKNNNYDSEDEDDD